MTCAGKRTIEGNKELLSRHKPGKEYEGEMGKMKLTGTRVPIEQKRTCILASYLRKRSKQVLTTWKRNIE